MWSVVLIAVRDWEGTAHFGAQWSPEVGGRTVSSNGASAIASRVPRPFVGSIGPVRGYEKLKTDKGLRRTWPRMTPNEDVQCRTPTSSRGSLITFKSCPRNHKISNKNNNLELNMRRPERAAFCFVAGVL